jgi:hypothetical protein
MLSTKQKHKPKHKQKRINTCYNKLPIKVNRRDFNKYISPCLSKSHHGPAPKISYYKIFNYILYVLHTGIQWRELKTCRNEIHWSNVYRHHNRWSKDGSYENLFETSIRWLNEKNKLDLSILHGDGSNVVAKKGAKI